MTASTKAVGGNELACSEGRVAGARLMRGRGVRLRGRQELVGIVGCLDFILSVMGTSGRFLIGAQQDLITYEHNRVITNSKYTFEFITPSNSHGTTRVRRLNLKYFHSTV